LGLVKLAPFRKDSNVGVNQAQALNVVLTQVDAALVVVHLDNVAEAVVTMTTGKDVVQEEHRALLLPAAQLVGLVGLVALPVLQLVIGIAVSQVAHGQAKLQ
jgi:hypothetical protein